MPCLPDCQTLMFVDKCYWLIVNDLRYFVERFWKIVEQKIGAKEFLSNLSARRLNKQWICHEHP